MPTDKISLAGTFRRKWEISEDTELGMTENNEVKLINRFEQWQGLVKLRKTFPLGLRKKEHQKYTAFLLFYWDRVDKNAETEAHSLTLQLTCKSCSRNALLCKSTLQAEPKARSLCPRILSLAFLFRRCQLLRSLAVVLLRIASMHWQLNLALQSKSTQAAWAWAQSQGYPASHTLPLLYSLWPRLDPVCC